MQKIIFFGTSEIAVPSLERLHADGRFEIVGIVTQPDRPVGRHATLTPPPVKTAAFKLGITEIHQPEKLKDESFRTWIGSVGPSCDAFVLIAYGRILPQWLLDLPKMCIVNLHPSLLPRWRGPSPIQAAIAAGDTMTGVTIMKIDAEMDHGPILAQTEEPIQPTDTAGSLHDRLATFGADILPDVVADYLTGKIIPQEQDDSLATVCKILSRDDGKLDPTKTAEELERIVRAFNPWPGMWIDLDGKRLKVITAMISAEHASSPGIGFSNGHLLFTCSDGTSLELFTVQPEGRSEMSGADFARGYFR